LLGEVAETLSDEEPTTRWRRSLWRRDADMNGEQIHTELLRRIERGVLSRLSGHGPKAEGGNRCGRWGRGGATWGMNGSPVWNCKIIDKKLCDSRGK